MSDLPEPTVLFLIYAPSDQTKVLSLYDRLRAQGFTPWMDIKDVLPGERRAACIQKAFREADFILACLSKASISERGFAQAQIRDAVAFQNAMLENDIYLIPARLEDCELPEYLRDLQGADLFKDSGWSDLLKAIQIGKERRPTPICEPNLATTESPTTQAESFGGGRPWEMSEQSETGQVILRFPGREAIGRLQFRLETEHFIIHFGFRNPTEGKGIGRDGVRDPTLINKYADSLERGYQVMTGEPWSRQTPIVGAHRKTLVYVFDTNAFTSYDVQMVPFLCLSANSNEPTGQADLHLAESLAIHEVAHLFNFRERPFYDLSAERWAWFEEAFASFLETVISPDSLAYLRFVSDWIESPNISLDEFRTGNHALVFFRYAENQLGADFLNRVWTLSEPWENPFDTMVRLMPKGKAFSSNDPNDHDLFASGYCMDGYFLADPQSGCFMPEAHKRYGDRAVDESWCLGPGETQTTNSFLDHLSCKYYRLYPKAGTIRLELSLLSQDSTSVHPLKVEIAIVHDRTTRGKVQRMKLAVGPEGSERLVGEVSLSPEAIDHLVVVVSNCGMKPDQNDNKEYTLQVCVS